MVIVVGVTAMRFVNGYRAYPMLSLFSLPRSVPEGEGESVLSAVGGFSKDQDPG